MLTPWGQVTEITTGSFRLLFSRSRLAGLLGSCDEAETAYSSERPLARLWQAAGMGRVIECPTLSLRVEGDKF